MPFGLVPLTDFKDITFDYIVTQYIPTHQIIHYLFNNSIRSYSQQPEALILIKLIEERKAIGFKSSWAKNENKTSKVSANVQAVLKREEKLEYCPMYYEEPFLSFSFTDNEYDVVASGLCLTTKEKKDLVKKSYQEGK